MRKKEKEQGHKNCSWELTIISGQMINFNSQVRVCYRFWDTTSEAED